MFEYDDDDNNPSGNPSLDDVIDEALSRRRLLKMGGAAASIGFMASLAGTQVSHASPNGGGAAPAKPSPAAPPKSHPKPPPPAPPLIGFTSVPLPGTAAAEVIVPSGYTSHVLYSWGDPVSDGPAWLPDASQGWAEQEQQAGMHHDGIAYFPLEWKRNAKKAKKKWSQRGLLCINHEYTDIGLLFSDFQANWNADKSKKMLAAHGVSVIEVRRKKDAKGKTRSWVVRRPSKYGRRITGYTPMDVVGPARGSDFLKTAADPAGTTVLGTLNNCGGAATPWGTYVTGEENYDFYFKQPTPATLEEKRYMQSSLSGIFKVHEGDPRFDMRVEGNRNEPNRFGWIVEVDPYKPGSTPKKLTALGRFKHEMAMVRLTADGRAVAYSGDDERNNYLYKFVASRTVKQARKLRKSPLEDGTLYVAKFNAGGTANDDLGTGEWIPLTPSHPALSGWTLDKILVFTRLAADAVGATRMDRPEWISIAPDGQGYVTCTNNTRRGTGTTNSTEGDGGVTSPFTAPADEVNPRASSATVKGNPYGHIVRWREDGDADSTTFTWDIFVLAGDRTNPASLSGYAPGGNINGDDFACPDAVTVDRHGRVWVGTDMFSTEAGVGAYANLKNNVLLAANPTTKEFRRFLVGPVGCEVTGITFTPDSKTMFVDIQHPGEPAAILSSKIEDVTCSWPGAAGSRPRSSTLVITKDDGGVIGT